MPKCDCPVAGNRTPSANRPAMCAAIHFLCKDCYACRCQHYWIVLSTRDDRYLCIAHADLSAIGHRLHGWHAGLDEDPAPAHGSDDSLIESLTSRGVITGDRSQGKPFTDSDYPVTVQGAQTPGSTASASRGLPWLGRFLLACSTIDWLLRTRSLSHTLARIERRRLRIDARVPNWNTARGARLIAAFKSLRPLYPRPYLCLFDSLAQLEFLARSGLFPRLVFGVIAEPFQAHCWLQDGSAVLNDDLERVRKFKPILSI
jgi:Transglutaminase-like superfamily